MKVAPEYAPYPQAQRANYKRWLVNGAALLGLVFVGADLLESVEHGSSDWSLLRLLLDVFTVWGVMIGVAVLWLLALLLRVLYYRLNWHVARYHANAATRVQHTWWIHHRQKVGLIESVLLGAACSSPEHRQSLFSPEHQPPVPETTPEGPAIRLLQVLGRDVAERERQLAALLALQWVEQRTEPEVVQPVCCYWQGSLDAWQAFVEQMKQCCPQMQLPEQPEPWQGMQSLDSIIDRLHGAAWDIRILCAGCHSSPPEAQSHMPAGEAAVLWLLGPRGRVRLSRGEWFAADAESLASVAERASQQSELKSSAPVCVSFSQPDMPPLSVMDWNTRQHLQDANFGALQNLEAMVVQTLAAWYAEQHGVPCAWLANDPQHTLALGIVESDHADS